MSIDETRRSRKLAPSVRPTRGIFECNGDISPVDTRVARSTDTEPDLLSLRTGCNSAVCVGEDDRSGAVSRLAHESCRTKCCKNKRVLGLRQQILRCRHAGQPGNRHGVQ